MMRPNVHHTDRCRVTTDILATIGAIVLILRAAAMVPCALAELVRSCQPVLTALLTLHNKRRDLRAQGTGQQVGEAERDVD